MIFYFYIYVSLKKNITHYKTNNILIINTLSVIKNITNYDRITITTKNYYVVSK